MGDIQRGLHYINRKVDGGCDNGAPSASWEVYSFNVNDSFKQLMPYITVV
jgi:hypothetical protein